MASTREPRDLLELDLLALDEGAEWPPTSRNVREAILATVGSQARFAGFVQRLCRFLDLGEARVRELLTSAERVDQDPWHSSRIAGVRMLHFKGGPNIAQAHAGLVQILPGVLYPAHGHRGDEWAFVLQGSAREDTGRLWEPGDLVHNPAGSRHSFRVLSPEPFLFFVVVHEGIDFENPSETSE